jgi:hypothetical protein
MHTTPPESTRSNDQNALDNPSATPPEPAAVTPKGRKPRPPWYHPREEPRPPEYKFGPLVGTQLFLAKIICPVFNHAIDRRALQGLARADFLWIVKSPGCQCCRVYFSDDNLYAQANKNRLVLESEQKQT